MMMFAAATTREILATWRTRQGIFKTGISLFLAQTWLELETQSPILSPLGRYVDWKRIYSP